VKVLFDILEQEANKPFKIKGIAMIKNSLSKNGRYYSDKLVESVVNKVKSVIEANGSYPLTMMADHPNPFTSNKTLSTVGKITDMYLEGDNAVIEAVIANTSVGKDVQELIKGQFVEGLSIRASKGKMKKRNINGKMVNDVMEMELNGVDLVVNPGVDGAKVTDVIESSEDGVFISIEEEIQDIDINEGQEVKTVDLMEAKLADLREKRPDLVESLKQEFKPVFESEFKLDELQESINTLNKEKTELEGKLQESEKSLKEVQESEKDLKTKLEESENKLKTIEESEKRAKLDAHIAEKIGELKFADSVKDKIKEKLSVLESEEEIDKVLEEEVQYLEAVIKESTGVGISGKGKRGENINENIDDDDEFVKLVESM